MRNAPMIRRGGGPVVELPPELHGTHTREREKQPRVRRLLIATGLSTPLQAPVFKLREVEWSTIYIGFVLYMFTITTYFVNVGDIGMVIGLLGLLMLRQPMQVPLHLVLFGIYLGWSLLGMVTSPYPEIVGQRLIDYGKLWLIGLVAVNALRSRAQIQGYLIFITACFLLFPARGTIRNYVVGYRPAGRAAWSYIYANINDLAALTLLALGVALAVFVSERHRRIRLAALGSGLAFAVVILMTQSRGALVALGVFVLFMLRGQKRKGRALLLILLCGTAVVMVAPSDVWERARGLVNIGDFDNLEAVDEEGSAKQRWEIWKVAVSIIGDNAVTGVGLGAYPEVHHSYALNRGVRIAYGKRDTHSTYLNIAAETGVIGLFLFLAMIITVFVQAETEHRRLRQAAPHDAARLWFLSLGLLAYLTAGIWGSFPQLAALHVNMAVLVAVSRMESAPLPQPGWRSRGQRSPVQPPPLPHQPYS
jgi:O-antigen ligase